MERRSFLKVVSAGFTLAACGCASHWPQLFSRVAKESPEGSGEVSDYAEVDATARSPILSPPTPPQAGTHTHSKVANFDQDFPDDIFCEKHQPEYGKPAHQRA